MISKVVFSFLPSSTHSSYFLLDVSSCFKCLLESYGVKITMKINTNIFASLYNSPVCSHNIPLFNSNRNYKRSCQVRFCSLWQIRELTDKDDGMFNHCKTNSQPQRKIIFIIVHWASVYLGI